ncbi:MAG: hypothetical protein E7175_01255 [Erysipelotrichaceae bacterium]|nr:hypothetical protein [Erysipelotrichaceae bacterium]
MKKKLLIVPLLLSSLTLSGCFFLNPDKNPLNPTTNSETDKSQNDKYRLSDKEVNLVIGQSHTITLFEKEKDGTEKEYDNISHYIKYTVIQVEDTSIASVTNSGMVTALKLGTTVFKYTIGGINKTLECVINVVEKELDSISLKRYKKKSLINTDYDKSKIILNAKYKTGFIEAVTPTLVDDSKINTSKLGDYDLTVCYTLKGITKEAIGRVTIVESSSDLADTVELKHSIYEYSLSKQMPGLPLEGDIKTLVVPVKFTDSTSYITNFDNVKEDIGYAFNGTKEQTGYESVKTFYEKESNNKITFNSTISDWYEAPHPSTYYYDSDKQYDLTAEIADWYFTNHPEEDIKSYDVNHDGYFDGLYLIYGSPDYKTGNLDEEEAGEMWMAMKGKNSRPADLDKPTPNFYMWASFDTIYPSKEKSVLRTGNENGYSESAASGQGNNYELIHTHTLIHEIGHSFGLDDYYTYGGDTLYPAEGNMQTLTMMGHEPMSLLLYNWVDPIIPTETMTIDIDDFQSSHNVILLTPEWNDLDSPFDEYVLLELYAPNGLNEYDAVLHPKSHEGESAASHNQVGFRIWHCDNRLAKSIGGDEYIYPYFDPNETNTIIMSSNTPKSNKDEFQDILKLYLIRNDESYDYQTAGAMRPTDYFRAGDTFSMEKYASQFPNGGKLNSGNDLGWEVSIDDIYVSGLNSYGATLTLTKK